MTRYRVRVAAPPPAPHVQSCASPDGANGCWHAHAPMDSDAGGDDAPVKHGSHAVVLRWSEYVPPGHAEDVPSPPVSKTMKEPARDTHSCSSKDPKNIVLVPAGHALHGCLLASSLNVPCGHGRHAKTLSESTPCP